MTSPTQLVLVGLAILFLWKFFHRQTSILAMLVFDVNNALLDFILGILRFLLFGYVTYILVAVYGNLTRITSPSDIITILQARPSQIGAPGLIGVVLGVVIGIKAYRGFYFVSENRSGRNIVASSRRSTWALSFAMAVYKRIKR